MTQEDIKKLVDDKRAEQLTAQLCRHWEVATERLRGLVQDLKDGIDICVEAEEYAALMRMQSSVMALMELNKIPSAKLFSEYLERIEKAVTNTDIRQAVVTLLIRQIKEESTLKPKKSQEPFFDMLAQSLLQHFELPTEQKAAIVQKISAPQYMLSVLGPYLPVEELMTVVPIIRQMQSESNNLPTEEMNGFLTDVRQIIEELSNKMGESRMTMVIGLMTMMVVPGHLVSLMQQSRKDSKTMANLFDKVLIRVRESDEWDLYWEDHRKTLKVVSSSTSWNDIMTEESCRERAELGKIPAGLFAKRSNDRTAFDEDFLSAQLNDDELRQFIFHLAALSEIARELNPITKFGDEQLANNEQEVVGEAVLEAATKLSDLVEKSWQPHYLNMWRKLILNDLIFAELKVTRKSKHNNQFSALFFCHLVGEMKKSAVFIGHSDKKLAEKLVDKNSVDTFRKSIQEKLGKESKEIKKVFGDIFKEYKELIAKKKKLHST